MTLSSVDLPVPLRPMTQTRSPGSTCSARLVEQRQMAVGNRDAVECEEWHGTSVGTPETSIIAAGRAAPARRVELESEDARS